MMELALQIRSDRAHHDKNDSFARTIGCARHGFLISRAEYSVFGTQIFGIRPEYSVFGTRIFGRVLGRILGRILGDFCRILGLGAE